MACSQAAFYQESHICESDPDTHTDPLAAFQVTALRREHELKNKEFL